MGMVFGAAIFLFAYPHFNDFFLAAMFSILFSYPSIGYSVIRIRKAVAHRNKIVFKRFFNSRTVDLSRVTRVVVCDNYVWGGDWHLTRQLNAYNRMPKFLINTPGKLRTWNFKPGVFYINQDGTPVAMILARSYKDWRHALSVLPKQASVEHVTEKVDPDSEFWYSITPERENFTTGVFRFGCLHALITSALFLATPIVHHYLMRWLGVG